jgi:hypothetical protein
LRAAGGLALFCLLACGGDAAAGVYVQTAAQANALVAELRKSFTVRGQPIPPEIFRDMGDGDMADSGSIWVTVDAAAAVGSNLYYDEIKQEHGWISQKKAGSAEEIGYEFIGATSNGLLVAVAAYSGGGSGDFFTLHILDVAVAPAFDDNGKLYRRINLTLDRSVALGDRWDGEAKITRNVVTITKLGPGVGIDSGKRQTVTIEAVRP